MMLLSYIILSDCKIKTSFGPFGAPQMRAPGSSHYNQGSMLEEQPDISRITGDREPLTHYILDQPSVPSIRCVRLLEQELATTRNKIREYENASGSLHPSSMMILTDLSVANFVSQTLLIRIHNQEAPPPHSSTTIQKYDDASRSPTHFE